MKTPDRNWKGFLQGLLFGIICISAASTQAMSHLVSLAVEPVWPTSPAPGTNLVYRITAGRSGEGLLDVVLSAGALPARVSATFSPTVIRFTGNKPATESAVMTVFSSSQVPVDSYPFTITGAARRESLTITNLVTVSAQSLASRPVTLNIYSLVGGVTLRGLGATGKNYQIEATHSLSNPAWIPLGDTTADANGRLVFFTNQTATNPACFFRAITSSAVILEH